MMTNTYNKCASRLIIVSSVVITLVNYHDCLLFDGISNVTLSSSSSLSSLTSSGSIGSVCSNAGFISCGDDLNFCFAPSSKCDGITDCPNNNFDESIQNCGCPEGEFKCENEDDCIDISQRCNRKQDCSDGSDEQNCETIACPPNHIKCENNFCVGSDRVCDFKDDCGDMTDEQNCTIRKCWFMEWRCDNGYCVESKRVCDGKVDCQDGSDEKACNDEDFRDCGNGERVQRSFWCDNFVDCPNSHADELDCGTCDVTTQYTCQNGRCIGLAQRCNGICDCAGDCEDEDNCEQYYQIVKGVIICNSSSSLTCSMNGGCVPHIGVCNKFLECPYSDKYTNGLDEYGCDFINNTKSREKCLGRADPGFWCPEGRCLHRDMRCNFSPECINGEDEHDCEFPECDSDQFRCENGQCIEKFRQCDSKIDCHDKSDELYCDNFICPEGMTKCAGGQCIPKALWCDQIADCLDKSDEKSCSYHFSRPACDPLTEFTCDNKQCISIDQRCMLTGNKRLGCADESHLAGCQDFECPKNSTKCVNSHCVHQDLVCDSKIDCKRVYTDEEHCPWPCADIPCPCRDTWINCTNFEIDRIPLIESSINKIIMRGNYLGPNLTATTLRGLDWMMQIDLSNCSIERVEPRAFSHLWRLRILALSDNSIEILVGDIFYGLHNLGTIHLNGNKIKHIAPYAMKGLSSIKDLYLGHQMIKVLYKGSFFGMKSLKTLDLSYNQLTYIEDGAFSGLSKLISLDLYHNMLITIGSKTFAGLHALKYLRTDEFRFCCLATHIETCLPKPDEFSSCEDLLSNIVLRICIWILGTVSITGNCVVLFCRTQNRLRNSVNSFLIANLALGDMLMGIYLLLIGIIDYRYRGEYFIHDSDWRRSSLCQFAGFLSTLSSELSVFTLTIITVDRFLRIIFPLKFKRFRMTNARIVMLITWLATVLIAGLPLLEIEYFHNFYGRSGVCLSLHITHQRPTGWEYSVFVFLVLNFISFFFIAVAYVWMFVVAKRTRSALKNADIRLSSTMAKRIMLIVMTDFLCWMPIIALGVVSLNGVELPPQVFAWVAVFILPLNAAMNPILYTLSALRIFGRSASRSGPETKSSFLMRNGKKAIAFKYRPASHTRYVNSHNNHSFAAESSSPKPRMMTTRIT